MIKKCIGCGLVLQNENEDALGYTPLLKNDYCRRCFRLKNYGEKNKEYVDEQSVLKRVNDNGKLAFFLVDYLNINAYTINLFNKINIPKILVISKCDILRKEIKQEKIIKWLNQVYKIKEQVLFVSSKPFFPSHNLFKAMDQHQVHTAYILGITNAGKSSLINKLLKEHHLKKEILATNKPNTTLDFIKIKIGEYTLFDTPGFSYETLMLDGEIRPISYKIKSGTTLMIANYSFFFLKDNKVVYYGIKQIKRKIVNTDGLPLKVLANHDIVLPGVGYLNVKEECQVLANQDHLEVRMDVSEDIYE